MASNASNELAAIRSELVRIIADLEEISGVVRSDFRGIGNELCSDCINRAVSQYYNVLSKLDKIDV